MRPVVACRSANFEWRAGLGFVPMLVALVGGWLRVLAIDNMRQRRDESVVVVEALEPALALDAYTAD